LKQTGESVLCVNAASQWYSTGDYYKVFKDHKGNRYVLGSDGHYDRIDQMISKFKITKGDKGEAKKEIHED